MPKKTEEKNIKGKKTTKASTIKKTTKAKKTVNPAVEVKEVVVEKKEIKKGNKENSLMNNTPFVISMCIIILLVAVLLFTLCTKRVPLTSKGDEVVATIKGKKITANDLYASLKEENGQTALLNIVDEYIANKEVTITEDDNKKVKEIVDYYLEYAEYYKVDLATFLVNYVGIQGIETEDEFKEFVLKDYKKTLAVQKYIGEEAKEEDLKKYYKENYTDTLTVKHILIEIDKEEEDTEKAEKAAYDKAVKLIQKLNNTSEKKLDEKFEELAEKNSDDTGTYSNGGLVENFVKKDVDEAFYNASHELKDGEYTKEPVKSSFGYHIILKVSSKPVKKYNKIVDEVKKSYAENLLASDTTLSAKKWDELRNQYKLSIKDDFIKKAYKDSLKEIEIEKTKTENN